MEEHEKFWKVTEIDGDNGMDLEESNRVEDLNKFFEERNEDNLYKIEKLTKEEFEETEN